MLWRKLIAVGGTKEEQKTEIGTEVERDSNNSRLIDAKKSDNTQSKKVRKEK
jgi:hypothetical protein